MKKAFAPAQIGIILILSVVIGQSVFAGIEGSNALCDWPGWRGVNNNNISSQKGIFGPGEEYRLNILWKKLLGSGYSSVSIASGRVVAMYSDHSFDYMVALDAYTGDELWRKTIDTTYKGHHNSQDGPISTPLIDGDVVYGLGPKGHLFAVSLDTGAEVWSSNLETVYKGKPPFHGFGTSPIIYKDTLILEIGGQNSDAVGGFNKNTGERLWAAGADNIQYQSPIIMKVNSQDQAICAGEKFLYALNPVSGEKLWEYQHDGNGWQAGCINPVLVDGNRLLLTYKDSESILIEPKQPAPEVKWISKGLRGSFCVPVYFDGYIYGYNSKFLTCLDPKTGETKWKYRQPGEGFMIVVDGHLVILTFKGSMHIAKASPEGYQEITSLKLFDDLAWTPPSFADGRIYVRSHGEIACVEIQEVRDLASTEASRETVAPDSAFQQFIQKVQAAENKKGLIDTFMSQVREFPIIENDNLVHFVYRGDAEDMGIKGDLTDSWYDELPMNRVPGTDFFYYSSFAEPDACLSYQFIRDTERIADPNNPRKAFFTLFGDEREEISWFSTPGWVEPEHLVRNEAIKRGKIETKEFESKIAGDNRRIDVYTPPGYDEDQERYPVAYIHSGQLALEWGDIPNTLDNIIGKSVSPIIAVFIFEKGETYWNGDLRQKYSRILAEELVPFVDGNYRTIPSREARANIGTGFAGFVALTSTLKYSNIFGNVSCQSIISWLFESDRGELKKLISNEGNQPVKIYLEWGKYDFRIPTNGWSVRERSVILAKDLTDSGYNLVGGEVNDGFGWVSWRNRMDRILEMFFPLAR